MNISSMRSFDRLLGVPSCFLLTAIRSLVRPFRKAMRIKPRKVIFIKLAEQGSTVLAYRGLKVAADKYGRENLYFMVFEENRFILDLLDVVPKENVIAIRTGSLIDMIGSSLNALLRVRRERIDAAVDLEFFARSTAMLSFLTGAPIRVGYHAWHGEGPYRGNLMTHRLFINHHLHTTDAIQLLVEALDQPPEKLPCFNSDIRLTFGRMDYDGPVKTRFLMEARDEDYPLLQVSAEEKNAVVEILKKAGDDYVAGKHLILLNVNCGDLLPLRRWPEKNYVEIAQRLLENYPDLYIALTGGPNEAAGAAALVNRIDRGHCFSMAGRTTMKQLLTLYHVATVMITNDSGPAHFASLTPVECVTLFGPETPALFGSRSSRSHLLWAATAFTPCVNALNNREAPSTKNNCMELIPVEDVYATVDGILRRHGVKGRKALSKNRGDQAESTARGSD